MEMPVVPENPLHRNVKNLLPAPNYRVNQLPEPGPISLEY